MLWIIHHWWIPLLCAVIWWGMLIALMSCWAAQGHPIYKFVYETKNRNQHILYISDIAATNLQPIFIACAGAQGICFVASLIAERYLRHAGRLLPNYNRTEKVLAGCSVGFAIIGQLGILFVSIFNTKVFPHVHVAMLCIFIVGIAISVLFTIGEYVLLDRNYSGIASLRISYILKAIWFVIELALAIGFCVLSTKDKPNGAAILEWTLSFVYGFYLCIFAYDLSPAARTKKGEMFERQMSQDLSAWTDPERGNEPKISDEPPMNENENLESSTLGESVLHNRQNGAAHF